MNYSSISPETNAKLHVYSHAAYSTFQGLQHTYLLADDVFWRNIPGDFVECGVANGALAAAMGLALQQHGHLRAFHLFDSFQGIPLAGPNDTSQPGVNSFLADRSLPLRERLKSTGISGCPVAQVAANLRGWGLGDIYWIFHKGWFQDTLPTHVLPKAIAILRLDGDLYESTQCCLAHLYPRVSPGGCIILDDYPLPGSRLAMEEYFIANPPKPQIRIEVETGAAHWFKL